MGKSRINGIFRSGTMWMVAVLAGACAASNTPAAGGTFGLDDDGDGQTDEEACNNVDDDADGVVDEDCADPNAANDPECANGACPGEDPGEDPDDPACNAGQCPGEDPGDDPDDPACNNGQCPGDDPGCDPAAEVCNGLDDDCDGVVDEEGCDDPDQACGGVECAPGEVCLQGVCVACQNGACNANQCASDADCDPTQVCENGVCIDNGDPGCDPAAEVCNGVDDDCDGEVDEEACNDPGQACAGVQCPAGQACQQGVCVACQNGAC